ncbi:MAG: PTS sugar transporter subunit IIA [Spirochaetales bacterium]|nr:PTS sugar transporter subunit IIA [Spirochaetales bacterium]
MTTRLIVFILINMKLSSLIDSELVFPGKVCATKDELIEELLAEVYQHYKPPLPKEKVRAAIFDRENLGGTVFEEGIAVPHARLEDFNDLLIVTGIPASPIQSGGFTLRMMVLMLLGPASSALYLNALSAFMKMCQDRALFDKLCASSTPAGFVQLLRENNVEVTSELKISAVMRRGFPFLRPENTVKEAADMFYKNNVSYLPILDEKGLFAGELTVLDLFAVGIPDYAVKLGNLNFLTSFEPFEELLKKENVIKIRDVMKNHTVKLKEDSPVIEAIMKFVQSNRRFIPVIRDNMELAGVVSYMDILHKVLRA